MTNIAVSSVGQVQKSGDCRTEKADNTATTTTTRILFSDWWKAAPQQLTHVVATFQARQLSINE